MHKKHIYGPNGTLFNFWDRSVHQFSRDASTYIVQRLQLYIYEAVRLLRRKQDYRLTIILSAI